MEIHRLTMGPQAWTMEVRKATDSSSDSSDSGDGEATGVIRVKPLLSLFLLCE